MSSDKVNISIDFGWIFLACMALAFCGEPDIHDAVIYNLSGGAILPEDVVIVRPEATK